MVIEKDGGGSVISATITPPTTAINPVFNPSVANAENSLAILGGTTEFTATNSLALGGAIVKDKDIVRAKDEHGGETITTTTTFKEFYPSVASGENSLAILGGYTDDVATNSIAIGHGGKDQNDTLLRSIAYAENSLAVLGGVVGNNAKNSIALGVAQGKDDNDNDVVSSSTAFGINSVAMLGGTVGFADIEGGALTQPKNALAIGLNANALGSDSIAIGIGGKDSLGGITHSEANADASLAVLGAMTRSNATYSIAMGGAIVQDESGKELFVGSDAAGRSSIAVLGGKTGYIIDNASNQATIVDTDTINAIALGGAYDAEGNFVSSTANGDSSVAMLGGITYKSPNDPENPSSNPINAKNSLAIGIGSLTNAADSLAVSGGTTVSGATNSIALGGAQGKDADDNVVFVSSTTNGKYSVAMLGGKTESNATNSLALGGAKVNGLVGVDENYHEIIKERFVSSEAEAENSIAVLGGKTGTVATNSLAIGAGSETRGEGSIALGYSEFEDNHILALTGPLAEGRGSIAIGKNSQALAEYSLAVLGGKTSNTATESLAIGLNSRTNAENSIALLGGITDKGATNSLAIGIGSWTWGEGSIALGNVKPDDNNIVPSTWAYGKGSIAIGTKAKANGDYSIAFGSNTVAGKLMYKNADGSETEAKIVKYYDGNNGRPLYEIVSQDGSEEVLADGFTNYDAALSNLTNQGLILRRLAAIQWQAASMLPRLATVRQPSAVTPQPGVT